MIYIARTHVIPLVVCGVLLLSASVSRAQESTKKTEILSALSAFTFPVPTSQCPGFSDDWKKASNLKAFYAFSTDQAKQQGNCLTAEALVNMKALASFVGDIEAGESTIDESEVIGWPRIWMRIKTKWNFSNCEAACRRKFNELRRDKIKAIAKAQQQRFIEQYSVIINEAILPSLKAQDPEYYESSNIAETLSSTSVLESYSESTHIRE